MPEFILQEYKHPVGKPPPKMIFTKNEYCDRIKMPGWDELKECEPKDNNPFDPPGGNQFLSTYNRIGFLKEDSDHFKSETTRSMEQIKNKEKYVIKPDMKPMIHYLTFKEKCYPRKPRKCPVSEDCAYDYISTMQDSYKFPYPCVIRPLTVPKLPFLQNRKLIWEDQYKDLNKFSDDCNIPRIQILQSVKGFRTKSFDPATGKYSDGSTATRKKRECVELPFSHVD